MNLWWYRSLCIDEQRVDFKTMYPEYKRKNYDRLEKIINKNMPSLSWKENEYRIIK